ncbi:hypothetical protein [Compostimonas suwonensis]|uniref:Uncharacterized protein n=1 Tax=Compostimonas suwonensis TaxID=1048394 RepID=A0A2M9BC79_9MICO|nr:hypothetical protein [Compostimonas suwonensis]PJJ55547.1 hypothetical protein CLV54_2894 [Compostimonas suwonensis]
MPPETVPPVITRRFGSEKAKPKITALYHASKGWIPPHTRSVVLAHDTAQHFRRQGFTMVRASWRLQTHEFSLSEIAPGTTL